MIELTREQAIEFYNSKVWEQWTIEEIARFQLFQTCVCVPFGLYHKGIEAILKRPVWTHEFANSTRLRQEYLTNALLAGEVWREV